jgi:hypothetical protein
MDLGKLPLWARVGLAAVSGMLYCPALWVNNNLGVLLGHSGGELYALDIWAALFGAVVLAPYAWSRSHRVIRVSALCVASTLAYALAFGVTVFVVDPAGTGSFPFRGSMMVVSAFLFAGGLGALLSAVAVRLIAGTVLIGRGWVYVLVAGVAGGAIIALLIDSMSECGWAFLQAAWQVLVCVALYFGVREHPEVGQEAAAGSSGDIKSVASP